MRLFVEGALVRTFEDLAPGETRSDARTLWGIAPQTGAPTYRFELESPHADPARHLTVLRGAALRRGTDVQLGDPRCTLTPNSVGPGVFLLAAGSASGAMELALDLASAPLAIEPGSAWFFQLWYRDPLAGGAGFNTSEALRIGFVP